MSTLNSANARTISSGIKGIDRDSPLSFAEAKTFKRKSYSFAIRYIENTDSPSSSLKNNLSTNEAERILNANLGLMVVQHTRDTWMPSSNKGIGDGNLCVSRCKSIGIPHGVSVWCDLEQVSSDAIKNHKQNIYDYCNRWSRIVSAAGYRSGLYVGMPCGLNNAELYHGLVFSNYWKSLSGATPSVEHTGYQMIQYKISNYLDGDRVQTDGAGHTPSMATYGSTVVGIDTTTDVVESHGGTYIFETGSPETPTVTVGSNGVVSLSHRSRNNTQGSDLWELHFIGKSGAAAGIYTKGPGESPMKRFVARVR